MGDLLTDFTTQDERDEEELVLVQVVSTILHSRGTIPSTRVGQGSRPNTIFDFSDEEKEWRKEALCLGLDQDIFFPERGESMLPAYAVCQACSVRIECLEYAITTGDSQGVRGGHTSEERKKIKRKVVDGATYEEASKPLDERRHGKFLKSRVRQQMLRQAEKRSA